MSRTYCELTGVLANSRKAKLDNELDQEPIKMGSWLDKARTHTHNPT